MFPIVPSGTLVPRYDVPNGKSQWGSQRIRSTLEQRKASTRSLMNLSTAIFVIARPSMKRSSGWDAVVHLGADMRVIESIEDPVKKLEINDVGTFNLLQAMHERHYGLIVNASTGDEKCGLLGGANGPVRLSLIDKIL